MRHQAGEDDVLALGRGEARLQIGAGERVGQFLLDHGFAGQRRQFGDDGAALGGAIEQSAWTALVGDVEDRGAGGARPRQQFCGVCDRGIGIG